MGQQPGFAGAGEKSDRGSQTLASAPLPPAHQQDSAWLWGLSAAALPARSPVPGTESGFLGEAARPCSGAGRGVAGPSLTPSCGLSAASVPSGGSGLPCSPVRCASGRVPGFGLRASPGLGTASPRQSRGTGPGGGGSEPVAVPQAVLGPHSGPPGGSAARLALGSGCSRAGPGQPVWCLVPTSANAGTPASGRGGGAAGSAGARLPEAAVSPAGCPRLGTVLADRWARSGVTHLVWTE